jgi:hypothetical protein
MVRMTDEQIGPSCGGCGDVARQVGTPCVHMEEPLVIWEQGETDLRFGLRRSHLFQIQQEMRQVGVRHGIVGIALSERTAPCICLDVVALPPHDECTRAQQPEIIGKAADSLIQHGLRFGKAALLGHDLGGTQPRPRRSRKARPRFRPEPESLLVLSSRHRRVGVRLDVSFGRCLVQCGVFCHRYLSVVESSSITR